MRQFKISLLSSFMLVFVIVGCAGDQQEVSVENSANQPCLTKIVKKVKDQKGIVYYHPDEQRLAVYVTIPGTYDSQDVGFICENLETLKDGLSITFSGNYFSYEKDRKPPVGGQKYYFLEVENFKIEHEK